MKLRSAYALNIIHLTVISFGLSTATFGADLTETARKTLREVLARESGWIKVHAAEVLAAYGEAQLVHTVFLAEQKAHDTELRYRNGIWRTLTLTAETPAERESWIARIVAVMTDPAAPDRLHAVECLAKLGGPHSPDVQSAAAQWLGHATTEDAVFVQWLRWQSGDGDAWRYIISQLRSPMPNARLRAAYILRRTGATDASALTELAQAADREPADSTARPYIVGSAYARQAAPDRLEAWRGILENLVVHGTPAECYEALQALMPFYQTTDLARLEPLLTHAHGDMSIGAAWAILAVTDRARQAADSSKRDHLCAPPLCLEFEKCAFR